MSDNDPTDEAHPFKEDKAGIWIEGKFFNHSAAKFWPRLIQEIQTLEPECNGVILSAPGDFILERNTLFPELGLEGDWLRLGQADLRELWREAIAQMNLLGMPEWTSIRLVKDRVELDRQPFPPEYVDADTFLYLLVWLLEWAGIHEEDWGKERLCGEFHAEDRQHGFKCAFQFELRQRHLHEGLYERSVRVGFYHTQIAGTGNPS